MTTATLRIQRYLVYLNKGDSERRGLTTNDLSDQKTAPLTPKSFIYNRYPFSQAGRRRLGLWNMQTDWWSALKSAAEAEPFNIKTEMCASVVPCHRTGEVGAASATLRTPPRPGEAMSALRTSVVALSAVGAWDLNSENLHPRF